jgi:DNA invertase Pin-like site-specific DNA recombinase
MKVVVYVRVATEEQVTNGQSLDAQRAKLQAYASRCGLILDGSQLQLGSLEQGQQAAAEQADVHPEFIV